MNIKSSFSKLFLYSDKNKPYDYDLSETQISNNIENTEKNIKKISYNLKENEEYIKVKYNALINSDIVIRNFNLNLHGKLYNSLLFYIDGMVDSELVNSFVLKPLMLKNKNNTFSQKEKTITSIKKVEKSNEKNKLKIIKLKKISDVDYIYNSLIPQNSIKKVKDFSDVFTSVNSGGTCLIIDSIDTAFCLDIKGYEKRSIDRPNNEVVIHGSQEAFVENIRTNTSMIRRIINNENLIIENLEVGKVSKTSVSLCYMANITNDDLVNEVRFRINNLKIDSILSSDSLDRLIENNPSIIFPQMISTERPDRACKSLFEGRIVILVNGTPFALIAPAVFIDFLASPEDINQKHQFANLIKTIRIIAFILTVFLPGLYVAIINYHQELIPTDLIFAIAAGRKGIPFPVIIEILIMEISFELIREASLRIPSPMGSTVGIIGGLILGEAAVSANIVSPFLIIIVAITGICSFAIPDYSLGFCLRLFRFIYILLGFVAGFLGIAFGFYIQLIYLSNLKSFGVSYFSPYVPSRK